AGENLVGSHPTCEVTLPDPAVSRHHAVLVVGEDRIEVADLSSENGTAVDGRSLRGKTRIAPGTRLTFGTVEAELEGVPDDDLERAEVPSFGDPGAEGASELAVSGDRTTASVGSVQRWALAELPDLVAEVNGAGGRVAAASRIGSSLRRCLPSIGVRVEIGEGGVLFEAGEEPPEEDDGRWSRLELEDLVLAVGFTSEGSRRLHEPIVRTARELLRLATRAASADDADERRRDPRSPGRVLWPDPPTVDPAVREIYEKAEIVAPGDIHVLIRGGSGTGKEVLARFIHRASRRSEGPFVTLNCAALPADLQESELFGIEKGVATGVEARAGKFELAHGGTLFLDEIGDMAPATQAKILRALQEGEIYRLGSHSSRPADIRVISATNRDLRGLLAEGAFREDLYHRIADWEVELPPLRERPGDIPNLAAWFLEREARRLERPVEGLSRRAVDVLSSYAWPGNIRQLEREIARAVLFTAPGELLETSALSDEVRGASGPPGRDLKSRVERFERNEVRRSLELHGGNVAEAAEELGVSVSTLYRKIDRYGLSTEDTPTE
ncbi:MAG: sigma 54-interacting transcriptional regulator, partial [Thermoanaerobaculia bacterium]|nr:sigma 54-interacting transcriptional regulator [Thermoanaerobaculia bacterium]